MAPNSKPAWQPPPSPRKRPDRMTPLEKRSQLIKLRLEGFERGRKLLCPQDRWPTVKGVRGYKEEQARLTAKAATPSPPPVVTPPEATCEAWESKTSPTGESSSSGSQTNVPPIKGPIPKPTPSFPFPITTCKQLTSFTKFPFLPTELRLHIWEIAFFSPKIIEIQYCTDFYQPTFVNVPHRQPLRAVCRESEEVVNRMWFHSESQAPLVMQSVPRFSDRHPQLTFADRQQALRNGEPSQPWPQSTVRFYPSRDTIFFRSLDLINFNFLSTLRSRVNGVDKIQHLAISLDSSSLARSGTWAQSLWRMRGLKSLTFMVGSKEKSWIGNGVIGLRPLEQWFVDGRKRWVECCGGGAEAVIDVTEVAMFLLGPDIKLLAAVRNALPGATMGKQLSVRVVAWKKN